MRSGREHWAWMVAVDRGPAEEAEEDEAAEEAEVEEEMGLT